MRLLVFLKIMLYYGYLLVTLRFILSPGENHECAGHNGGNVDRSIGRDLPHSSAGSQSGVHCLEPTVDDDNSFRQLVYVSVMVFHRSCNKT